MLTDRMDTEFAGDRGRLFRLALVTSIWTVLTLGIYRFWMKTRLRRFYWSAIRPGGLPLEYVGQPMEKLLGFLIAVVFLAFYLGIANLILAFLSFSLLGTPFAAYALSLIGIAPLIFYAQYRARRYILARTRWRAIRFGLEPGAWGYAGRAMIYWILTIVSAGLLWPLMTFKLEKYMTDRTWYGDKRLTQGGRWTMLYGAYKHVLIAAAISVAVVALAIFGENEGLLALLILTVPYGIIGWVYFRVNAFRMLTETKEADGVRLASAPRTGRVIGIYVGGSFMVSLCSGVAVGILGTLGVLVGSILVAGGDIFTVLQDGNTPVALFIAGGIILYFGVFLLYGVFIHIFITLPLFQHYAETLSIIGASGVAEVQQRDRDAFAEAEGFAEALDVGASI